MSTTISIIDRPESIEAFTDLRNQHAASPEGGAAMFIMALKLYMEDEKLGIPALVFTTDRSRLQQDTKGYKGWSILRTDMSRIISQLRYHPYLPDSYFDGTNPANQYQSQLPYKMFFSRNPYSGQEDSGKVKVFVACSGADSDRPITLRRNDKGLWKAIEWSSILVGIRKPEQTIDDDL